MELTFVVAVKAIWQLQPSWLHPCKVCDQGRSVCHEAISPVTRTLLLIGINLLFILRNHHIKNCI